MLKNESGFLFAEILVAMVIFSILTLVAWKGISNVMTIQETNRQRNTALAIATQFMDEEKARYLMEDYNIDAGDNYTIEFEDGHGVIYKVNIHYFKHNNPIEEDYYNQLSNIYLQINYPSYAPEPQQHKLAFSSLVNYRTFLEKEFE